MFQPDVLKQVDELAKKALLGEFEPYHWLWDNETQGDWPIIEIDGKLYGFPNSADDGQPISNFCFLR